MTKKVPIKAKSKTATPSKAADEWVEGKEVEQSAPDSEQATSASGQGNDKQKMKRLTIDVSENLHRRIKVECASRGVKMADEIRGLLEREFSKENR